MKEFDKWFKKHKPYEVYSCMDMAEKSWRAALGWVEELLKIHSNSGGGIIDYIRIELSIDQTNNSTD